MAGGGARREYVGVDNNLRANVFEIRASVRTGTELLVLFAKISVDILYQPSQNCRFRAL